MIWLHGEKKAVIQPDSPLIDVVPDDTPWLRGPAGVDDIPSDWVQQITTGLVWKALPKESQNLSLVWRPVRFFFLTRASCPGSHSSDTKGFRYWKRNCELKKEVMVGAEGWGIKDCVVDDMKNAAGFYGPYLACVGTPCHNNRETAPAFSVIP